MAAPLPPDALWDLVQPFLPIPRRRPKGGRPRVSDRACLTGIVFVLRSSNPWQMLPPELWCGSGTTLASLARLATGGWVTLNAAIVHASPDRQARDRAEGKRGYGEQGTDRLLHLLRLYESPQPQVNWTRSHPLSRSPIPTSRRTRTAPARAVAAPFLRAPRRRCTRARRYHTVTAPDPRGRAIHIP